MRMLLVALVLAASLAGCTASTNTTTIPTSTATSYPAPRADLDWGPMAVMDFTAGNHADARWGKGAVVIDSDCVYVQREGSDERITLVWASGEFRWDPVDRAIVNVRTKGRSDRIHDGDVIDIGGSEIPTNDVDWLVPPQDTCPTSRWSVGTYTKNDGQDIF